MDQAGGGRARPTDHDDHAPVQLSPGVYVPTAEHPRVRGRVLLQFMDNSPEVVVEFAADTPNE